MNKKILIAYFSYSGNTHQLADQIHEEMGGDMFEIKTINTYPTQYNAVVEQAKQENASDFRPELKANVNNIESYDIIFVGSPVWWYTVAPPVKTFLAENNLEGKTIVPFCTHEGSGQARSFSDIKKLAPKSTVVEGLEVFGSRVKYAQKKVSEWINKIGITK